MLVEQSSMVVAWWGCGATAFDIHIHTNNYYLHISNHAWNEGICKENVFFGMKCQLRAFSDKTTKWYIKVFRRILAFLDRSFVAYDTGMVVDVLAFPFFFALWFYLLCPIHLMSERNNIWFVQPNSSSEDHFFRNSGKALILELFEKSIFLNVLR